MLRFVILLASSRWLHSSPAEYPRYRVQEEHLPYTQCWNMANRWVLIRVSFQRPKLDELYCTMRYLTSTCNIMHVALLARWMISHLGEERKTGFHWLHKYCIFRERSVITAGVGRAILIASLIKPARPPQCHVIAYPLHFANNWTLPFTSKIWMANHDHVPFNCYMRKQK